MIKYCTRLFSQQIWVISRLFRFHQICPTSQLSRVIFMMYKSKWREYLTRVCRWCHSTHECITPNLRLVSRKLRATTSPPPIAHRLLFKRVSQNSVARNYVSTEKSKWFVSGGKWWSRSTQVIFYWDLYLIFLLRLMRFGCIHLKALHMAQTNGVLNYI